MASSLRGLVCLAVVCGIAAAPLAAQEKKLFPRTDTVKTYDGWTIPLTYFPSNKGKDAGVVILLHDESENQLEWKKNTLASVLWDNGGGYAIITCDLRKHGKAKLADDNKNPGAKKLVRDDYQNMANAANDGDLEAIQKFLFKEHQEGNLNMAKTAIVAVGMSAPVAINWAWGDWLKKPYDDAPTVAARTPRGQIVKAMVLISPETSVPGLSTAKPLTFFRKLPMNGFKPVSFLFCYSNKGKDARRVNSLMRSVETKGEDKFVFKRAYSTNTQGTDLLKSNKTMSAAINGFLKEYLEELDVPWADRRSRRDRR